MEKKQEIVASKHCFKGKIKEKKKKSEIQSNSKQEKIEDLSKSVFNNKLKTDEASNNGLG